MLLAASSRARRAHRAWCSTATAQGVNDALSGRLRIWRAATRHGARSSGQRRRRRAVSATPIAALRRSRAISGWPGAERRALHAHQMRAGDPQRNRCRRPAAVAGGRGAGRGAPGAGPMPARAIARVPAMLALLVTVFPLNTHLAFYSTFWGGVTCCCWSALYAGCLLAPQRGRRWACALLSGVVTTFDNAATLAACLASLASCDEIVVLDSGSTDAHAATSREQHGARIFDRSRSRATARRSNRRSTRPGTTGSCCSMPTNAAPTTAARRSLRELARAARGWLSPAAARVVVLALAASGDAAELAIAPVPAQRAAA